MIIGPDWTAGQVSMLLYGGRSSERSPGSCSPLSRLGSRFSLLSSHRRSVQDKCGLGLTQTPLSRSSLSRFVVSASHDVQTEQLQNTSDQIVDDSHLATVILRTHAVQLKFVIFWLARGVLT